MFHCLLQTESKGGVNQWVDGFHAAFMLHQEDPELFEILAKTPIAYRNITRTEVGEFDTSSKHPLIRFEYFVINQVTYNLYLRDDAER